MRRAVVCTLVAVVLLGAVAIAVNPAFLNALAAESSPAAEQTRRPVAVAPGPGDPTGTAAESDAGQRVVTVLPADGRRYFGVSVTSEDSNADPTVPFTAAVGVEPTMEMFFGSFAGTFDVTAARRITADGRLPTFTWEPFDHLDPMANVYPLQAIAAGQFDEYLRSEGERFASVDGPLVVRLAHEMNGDWYPWGVGVPGNTAADFVAAYRHVHDVVTAAGATNVVWMWAPNLIDADPSIALAPLYPGDDVVDWVGLSGYYTTEAHTFQDRFAPTLVQLDAVAPTKPILLAETAVERTSIRPAQITELVSGVLNTPRFVGFVWFNVAKRADWAVDDDPAAAAALGAAVGAGGFGAVPESAPAD
jgi:hypothetical protein